MAGFEINAVTLSGNLVRDGELRTLPSGLSIGSFRIATNKRVKNNATGDYEDQAMFFNVTLFKGIAEWACRELGKGDKIVVSGRLNFSEWTTDSGDKRSQVDISADSIVPVPRDGGSSRSSSGGDFQARDQDFSPPVGAGKDSDVIPFKAEQVPSWEALKGTRRA